MKYRKRILVTVVFVLTSAGAGGLWVAISGWPPIIIRDHQYRALISDFQKALRREQIDRGDKKAGWDFHIQVPYRQTFITVQAASHFAGVVTVKYQDEESDRRLYKYVDYTSTADMRTGGSVLYVHWVERLLRTDHWLLAYDMVNRREIARRKIDPDDLSDPQ